MMTIFKAKETSFKHISLIVMGFFFAAFFIVSATSSLAQEQRKSTSQPTAPIAKVDFNGGQYIQEDRNTGLWVEYDFNGVRRYEFTTLSFDGKDLRLQGLQGNVQILIDVENKTISGEWPGHAMAKLYDVTNVIYLSVPKAEPKPEVVRPIIKQTPPKLEQEQPNYIPPGKNPPKSVDVIKDIIKTDETPAPKSLKVAEYNSGKFIRQNTHNWFEKSNSGVINSFNQIGYDKDSIYLYDPKRRLFVELNIKDKRALSSSEGNLLKPLYPLTRFLKDPIPDSPNLTPIEADASEPGKLSAVERTQCLTNGGFIERAGMLGYERCTMRYSDGGNICIDSSNCEGKCLASADAANQNAVSGLCQITDNPFGCYAEVVAGTISAALCVD
ncbi:hypothetical protein DES40_2318 [Litorimonas taeanensis]|uniref:Uncharacterized protein n=1 Tax=Litorimonas taeanensis TaxID=568099 RepID=A0A420WEV7_9PROT|nr:hypothetical protein [Litorimonas taeanensis]RKQ69517.1 hypothetical protein DES40_2318 [Litorimonas taeanensis]